MVERSKRIRDSFGRKATAVPLPKYRDTRFIAVRARIVARQSINGIMQLLLTCLQPRAQFYRSCRTVIGKKQHFGTGTYGFQKSRERLHLEMNHIDHNQ